MTASPYAATQQAMDDAIRDHVYAVRGDLDDGLVPVEHLVLVGTRGVDSEGHSHGAVLLLMSNGSIPSWIARGLISEADVVIGENEEEAE